MVIAAFWDSLPSQNATIIIATRTHFLFGMYLMEHVSTMYIDWMTKLHPMNLNVLFIEHAKLQMASIFDRSAWLELSWSV
jgi:hypothetical protein